MTDKEQKTLDQLHNTLREMMVQNNKFREDVNKQVNSMSEKVDRKHLPIQLEGDILKVAQQSVQDAIKAVFTGYGSPLNKLVSEIVLEHNTELKALISDSFTKVIRTEEFKQSIVSAFSHKVARTIISNNDGLFDKVSNELKQDAIFKSKMALAVSNVVEECLKEKH